MVSRTVVDSVPAVKTTPENLESLEIALRELRDRFPGAVIQRYLAAVPSIGSDVHVAPGAAIVGDVRIAEQASVWFGCVLRGDVNTIHIGARSNVQDGTVIHLGDRDPTVIGEDVVIGHRAVVHGCTIEDACLIGIGATILDGARIGHGSVVGAGAIVTAGTQVPPRSLVLGIPGRVKRTLGEEDEAFHRGLAGKYLRLAHNHRHG